MHHVIYLVRIIHIIIVDIKIYSIIQLASCLSQFFFVF